MAFLVTIHYSLIIQLLFFRLSGRCGIAICLNLHIELVRMRPIEISKENRLIAAKDRLAILYDDGYGAAKERSLQMRRCITGYMKISVSPGDKVIHFRQEILIEILVILVIDGDCSGAVWHIYNTDAALDIAPLDCLFYLVGNIDDLLMLCRFYNESLHHYSSPGHCLADIAAVNTIQT